MNHPPSGNARSTGSNARVVCSTLLCALSPFAKARSAPRLCQRTDFMHARHTFICGRGFSHTRICSATSCDVFARVVSIKPCGRDRVYFFALPTARTRLPRSTPCDSVAYAEGVQKRNAFLFLSFSYFSDRRKVTLTYCYFSDKRKVLYASCTFA